MRTLTLFPDQEEIAAQVVEAMGRKKSILLQSCTGSGKTALATHFILRALKRNKKAIFSVPRKDLMEQTSDTFRSYGIPHSFIAAGKDFNPFAPVYIGMVETMSRRLKKLPEDIDLLIPDETHFGDQALENVIKHYKKPRMVKGKLKYTWELGLTATPWKLSGKGFDHLYEEMIVGKSMRWLIDNKRLSDYRYFYGRTKGDFAKLREKTESEIAEFMEQEGVLIGDCVKEYRERCIGRLHIVRTASIKHSNLVAQKFRDEGIPAMHVDGETPMDERKRIFRAYGRRELLVLTFCDLLNFGFDLAQASGLDVCIESASDLKPSKSLAGQMQFWGRALRYKDYPAIINDHVNNYIEHGLPCSDRVWNMKGRRKKDGGEKIPPTRQCPKCYYVHPPAPVCPNPNHMGKPCGHVYEIKSREIQEADGELRELDKEALNRSIKKQMQYVDQLQGILPPLDSPEALDYLIRFAQAEGYENPTAWAAEEMARRINKNVKQAV